MRVLQNLTIRAQLLLLAASTTVAALVLASIGFVSSDIRQIRASQVAFLRGQAQTLAFNCTGVLVFEDRDAAGELLASLKANPAIELARLTGKDGQTVATYEKHPGFSDQYRAAQDRPWRVWKNYVEVQEDVIEEDGEILGHVRVVANTEEARQYLAAHVRVVAVVLAVSLAAAVGLSWFLQRDLTRRLRSLADTALAVTRDRDYSLRERCRGRDEVAQLGQAFNRMLDEIESSQAALRQSHEQLEERVRQRTAELSNEIARRELIQQDLEKSKEAAEAASLAKSAFLANMSHEIRTPLNGILGFTELLLANADEGNEEERNDYLNTIYNSGTHLLALINDILDLSKIEAGQCDIERVACSTEELFTDAISVLRVQAEKKGLSLEYRWTTKVPSHVYTDPIRFRQLVVNLVGNAIKFTERGSVGVIAACRDEAGEHRLYVEVTDTGIGIPADKADCIFEPFVQADSSVTRRFGGTGLGLAISRRIAQALGGQLTVESQVGVGSTVRFSVRAGNLGSVQWYEHTGAEGITRRSSESGRPGVKLPPARILLVEDGETNRKLISLTLGRAGATVDTAENGRVGVEMAQESPYDLIIMDMQMPVMDGYSAATLLRRSGLNTPILALTAHAMKGDREKCEAAGCTAYLAKPIEMERLLSAVARLLFGARLSHDTSLPVPASPAQPAADDDQHASITSTLALDDPDIRDVVSGFVGTLHRRMRELTAARAASDCRTIAGLAHWLKGSGGTAGFHELTQPAADLEAAATAGDLAGVDRSLQTVEDLVARIDAPMPA